MIHHIPLLSLSLLSTYTKMDTDEKTVIQPVQDAVLDGSDAKPDTSPEAHEVFKTSSEGVNFRTVSWQRATVIFLKIQFAMSILSVPGSLATLGAVGGALSIVGWEVLNTCPARRPSPPLPVWLSLSG